MQTLRRLNSENKKVVVIKSQFLNTNRFKKNNGQHYPSVTLNFSTATNDSIEVSSMAIKALNIIYRKGFMYKKAGVILQDIVSQKEVQASLFDNINRPKRKV